LPVDFNERSIAIVGTGLIGGSIGLGLRSRGYSGEIVAFDRPEISARARARGAADTVADSLEAACRDASVVILATPVGDIIGLLPQVARCAAPGAVITDTGSTKTRIFETARHSFSLPTVGGSPRAEASSHDARADVAFVGGHPMAGRESGGIEHAGPDLFAGRRWLLLDETLGGAPSARGRIERLVRSLGAEPILLDAEEHDRRMALVSHLPQLLSSTLAAMLDDPADRDAAALAGPGLADMLRLAHSPYDVWRDILLTNSDEIERALERFQQRLEEVRLQLRTRETQRLFETARRVHDRLPRGS
jgi:prephenate dehydrogenase